MHSPVSIRRRPWFGWKLSRTTPYGRQLALAGGRVERLVKEAERSGEVARVTKLDNYYQFALEGTGAERLTGCSQNWEAGAGAGSRHERVSRQTADE